MTELSNQMYDLIETMFRSMDDYTPAEQNQIIKKLLERVADSRDEKIKNASIVIEEQKQWIEELNARKMEIEFVSNLSKLATGNNVVSHGLYFPHTDNQNTPTRHLGIPA